MIAINYPDCEQARLFYYDYLCGESDEIQHEAASVHISQCPHCHAEVEKLRKALEAPVDPEQQRRDLCIIETLSHHFAHVGKWLSCTPVKGFLPNLLIPECRIRIPTPITAHIAKCTVCFEDLEVIKRLQLKSKQLSRLGILFSTKDQPVSNECSDAKDVIPEVATLQFDRISPGMLKHVYVCPACNERLYQTRRILLDGLKKMPEHRSFRDNSIRPSDLFDYVVPHGIYSAHNKSAVPRGLQLIPEESFATYLANIQLLHRIIHLILRRDNSGIRTCFEFATSVSSDEPEKWVHGTRNNWFEKYESPVNMKNEERGENDLEMLNKEHEAKVLLSALSVSHGKSAFFVKMCEKHDIPVPSLFQNI